ncbi:MAG: hypothetical protein JWN77_1982 [Frankiales bacterium]|jgi:hypothetical protein|nr:hypothetical protein [Frankiales bacterium]
MDSSASRQMHKVLEPAHAMIYFAPEAKQEYEALGLSGQAELYFPSRAAALGVVPWQVVQATFFGFSPLAVQLGMAEAWTKTTPEAVLAARYRGADRALRRMAPHQLDDVAEALDLVRTACAGCSPEGRPLYAGHAALPEPAEPHVALWHGIAVLREFRGDGHLAALVGARITATQALVLHAAYTGGAMTTFLQQSRAWSAEEWAAAAAQLADRGWVDGDGGLTEAGSAAREAVEEQTDQLALAPWEHLGQERTDRLRELLTPLSKAVVAAGGLPIVNPRR